MPKAIMDIDLKEIERKVHRSEFLDGFAWILMGILLFITAGVINFSIHFVLVQILAIILIVPTRTWLQRRYTFPRLGYFKVKSDPPSKVIPGIIGVTAGIIVIFLVILFVVSGDILNENLLWKWLPTVFGIIMFGPSLHLVDNTGQTRYYTLGLFSFILGVFTSFLDFDIPKDRMVFYLLTLGTVAIIVGLILFAYFLRTYQVDDREETIEEGGLE